MYNLYVYQLEKVNNEYMSASCVKILFEFYTPKMQEKIVVIKSTKDNYK